MTDNRFASVSMSPESGAEAFAPGNPTVSAC
jgi:hypothetical protein